MIKRTMLDMETADTRVTAAIVSIGAVRFDENGVHWDSFYRVVKWNPDTRTVSRDTMAWWNMQMPEVREALFDPAAVPLEVALQDFRIWLQADSEIWAKSPDFDCSILAHAYQQFGFPVPWKYNATRCLRTLAKMYPEVPQPEFVGFAHNAVHDAEDQARHAVALLQEHQRRVGR